MDLLQEIYNEKSLKNTERLQLNKLILRIFSENATPEEKEILTSTSSDKTQTYITIFQRSMGMPQSGSIGDRAKFKANLAKLLWTYETEGERKNYTILFPYFKPPRTKEELDALISSIYPFACKFSPERVQPDTHGTPYKNKKFKLESVDTSGSFFDCLIHAFLTSMSKCYRQLSDRQRKAFAYYFRRVICPRYIPISDLVHTELYKGRASLSIQPSNYADENATSTVLARISENKILQNVAQELKTLIVKGLTKYMNTIIEETLARNFIKEFEFLEDRHISLLAEAFNVSVILINNIGELITIAQYIREESTHSIVLYNPGDGHFRGVRRTTDSTFYFESEDAELLQFIKEETAVFKTLEAKRRCPYTIGEVVLHNGAEKTVRDYLWQEESDSEGFINCASILVVGEEAAIPLAQITKKPSASGGKRSTRKQKRIFLKT